MRVLCWHCAEQVELPPDTTAPDPTGYLPNHCPECSSRLRLPTNGLAAVRPPDTLQEAERLMSRAAALFKRGAPLEGQLAPLVRAAFGGGYAPLPDLPGKELRALVLLACVWTIHRKGPVFGARREGARFRDPHTGRYVTPDAREEAALGILAREEGPPVVGAFLAFFELYPGPLWSFLAGEAPDGSGLDPEGLPLKALAEPFRGGKSWGTIALQWVGAIHALAQAETDRVVGRVVDYATRNLR